MLPLVPSFELCIFLPPKKTLPNFFEIDTPRAVINDYFDKKEVHSKDTFYVSTAVSFELMMWIP